MRFDEFLTEYFNKYPNSESPMNYLLDYDTKEIVKLYIKSGKKQMKIVYDDDKLDGGTIVFLDEVKTKIN
jgi:hypothetical protein